MIQIEQRSATNLKTKEALYVSFDYDLDKVAKVKSLQKRHYIPSTREWEVPVSNINDLLTLFQEYEVKIKGKVNSKVEKAVSNVVMFDNIEVQNFPYKTTPYQHQIEGFNYGMSHNKFLLGDDQGLGKTKQAIDIAVAKKSQFKHCLIICGVNGLKWNWEKEIEVHSDEVGHILGIKKKSNGKFDVGSVTERYEDLCKEHSEFFLITNVETLRDERIASKVEEMTMKGIIGMTIIDEIHKCKNAQSQQGKAVHHCKSFYKMALTGTPLMNEPIDLYNVLKWLDVEYHSFYSFRSRYCIMGGFGGYQVVGYKNLSELQELLGRNMLRRLKIDVLDLPEKVHITEYVEMTAKQKQIYKEIELAIKANIDQIKLDPNPLSQLIRLRQATGYTGILSSTVCESAKLERMEELVAELVEQGEKAIIFSSWSKMTDEIERRLAKYNPAVITGATADSERPMQEKKFRENKSCKVIIGTMGAMGTGLTLTAASTVIFVDEPWNKATKDQAEDRAHRIGQNSRVNVITILTKNTIDERINELVAKKGLMSDALVDGQLDKLSRAGLLDFLLS